MEFDAAKKMHVVMRRKRNDEERLRNHLLSIQRDAGWVTQAEELFHSLPLVANLRNGEWYGNHWTTFSYFKSGDGHNNEWKFSFTRLNLHIASLAAHRSGCIIVDSTRRGKQFPDSFYATIPIWCCIINTIVFDSLKSSDDIPNNIFNNFMGPPWMPKSQRSAIEAVISDILIKFPAYLKRYIRALLCNTLTKPLLPFWVSPMDGMLDLQGDDNMCDKILSETCMSKCNFTPIIMLSVSEDRSEKEHREEGFSWFYVKGAGDDHENWCRGLSPSVFWESKEDILSTDDPNDVDEIVDNLVSHEASKTNSSSNVYQTSIVDSCLSFGKCGIYLNRHRPIVPVADEFCPYIVIAVDLLRDSLPNHGVESEGPRQSISSRFLRVFVSKNGKTIRSNLGDILSSSLNFYLNALKRRERTSDSLPILVVCGTCEECHDVQLAICVALLLSFFDIDFDTMLSKADIMERCSLTKSDIQIWVGLVQSRIEKATLSRSLLKDLISFFGAGNDGATNSTLSKICDEIPTFPDKN